MARERYQRETVFATHLDRPALARQGFRTEGISAGNSLK